MDARSYTEVNRAHWDEAADLHVGTDFYAFHLERLRAGAPSLHRVEVQEVGDVSDRSMLHLQCHLGTESVGWARQGARVTGVDFSERAIAQARRIAAELRVDVRYVQANVYELVGVVDDQYDIVYTSWGVLCWLPDLREWARVVSRHLRPGGLFYIAESHPFAWVFDDESKGLDVRYAYFATGEPLVDDTPYSYADETSKLENARTFTWPYPLGEVATSLVDAGLRIEFIHELARCPFQMLPMLVPDESSDERWFRMPDGMPEIPLSFTLRAVRD